MQPDLKRLVAYSSVAHLGFVVLGIFTLTTQGLDGGIFTMISHGLTTGALFLLVGMLYDRQHTFEIGSFGGLWKSIPILGGLFLVAAFASIGLPGFSGFIGEFLSLIGTFLVDKPYAIVGAIGVILAAVYLLWAYQRVFTGEPNAENSKLPEITGRELACVRAAARVEPLPRHLPEAGARPRRAVGQGADRPRGSALRLPRAGCRAKGPAASSVPHPDAKQIAKESDK